ncbi:MAG: hypothetical protein IPH35_09160 [Rhodoferax sp.]|nr:hypothetical protein [Rhodoferax sp.]
MKTPSLISIALLALTAALSLSAQAADTQSAVETKVEKGGQPSNPQIAATPATATSAPANKNPALDRTKHFHPRDGK